MLSDASRDRVVFLAFGVLILLAPVVLLVITLGFLVLSGDLVLGRVTPLEFLELYIIELLLVIGFGYGIYRLTLWAAEHRLPVLLDTLDAREAMEDQTDDSPNSEEGRR